MKIGQIVKVNQLDIHNQLKRKHSRKRKKKRNLITNSDLSFHDIENMMRHSSYKRGKGGSIRQVRHE